MKKRGFTIVELVVVMTIMAILVSLGTFSAYRAQVNARDTERASDIASLARGLEDRYKTGNSFATSINVPNDLTAGQYPGNNEFSHSIGLNKAEYTPSTIPGGYVYAGATDASKTTPSGGTISWSCVWACAPTWQAEDPAFIAAYVTPRTDLDNYVYVPLLANGDICCCSGCVKFNLYYKEEATGLLMVVKSNRQ